MSSESIFTKDGLARERLSLRYLLLPAGALLGGMVLAHLPTTPSANFPHFLTDLAVGSLVATATLVMATLIYLPAFIRRMRGRRIQLWPSASKRGFDYQVLGVNEAVKRDCPTALVVSTGGWYRRTTTAWTTHRGTRLELPLKLDVVWWYSAVKIRWQLPKKHWWQTAQSLHFTPAQVFHVLVPFLESCAGYSEERYLEAFIEMLAQERVGMQQDIAVCVAQARSLAAETQASRRMAASATQAAIALAHVQYTNQPIHPLSDDDQELIQSALSLLQVVAHRIMVYLPAWPPERSLLSLLRKLQRREALAEPSATLSSRLRAAAQEHSPQ